MADLDYVPLIGRFGLTVADGNDPDLNPDTVWCDEGIVELIPLNTYTKVDSSIPWTAGHSVIATTINDQGCITWNATPVVMMVDMASTKVNPQASPGKATHKVQFKGTRARGTLVEFAPANVRISADTMTPLTTEAAAVYGLPVGTMVCDLEKLMPVPTSGGTAIVVGPPGKGIATLDVEGTDLVYELTDGTTGNAGPLPVGPGGTPTGIALAINDTTGPAGVAVAANQLTGLTTPADPRRVAVQTLVADGTTGKANAADVYDKTAADARYATAASVTGAVSASLLRPPSPSTRANVKRTAGAFAAGHGWTALGAGLASSNLNDTADVFFGSQSVSLTSNTTSGTVATTKTGLALDFTGADLRIVFKYNAATALNTLTLLLGDAGLANRYQVPILDLSTTTTAAGYPALPGDWCVLDIPWSRVELNAIGSAPSRSSIDTAQLNGTNKAGQVLNLHFDLIAAVPQDEYNQWGNGVLSLGLDDCKPGQFDIVRPILDANGDKCTLFPIIGGIGVGGGMTLAQMKTMADQGHEIGAHAFDTTTHAAGIAGLTTTARRAALEQLVQFYLDNGITGVTSYAYPNGDWSKAAAADVARYFASGRLAFATSAETARPANQFSYRAVAVNAAATASTITALMDQAKLSKGWLNLVLHDVVTSGATGLQANRATIQTIVDYAHTIGMPIRTVGEVISKAA